MFFFFFFSSRRRHTRFDCDWSSDVCSSDLLHIHGSSMVISATGKPATTTNTDAGATKNKPVEMEWYIHPNTQEGGRQFHSYSNDRELTVLGMFGTFVVEPKGSRYLDPIGTSEPTEMRSGWQAIIQNG